VIATNIRTGSVQAAFANGTIGHSEDFDDLGGCGGHPATVLTPTVLALATNCTLSGRDVLTAWVVGYEVGTRLSANNNTDRDWHPTAIYGTMAAAAAASKLLGLDAEKTRMALGIAGSEAGGLRRKFRHHDQAVPPGQASRNGVIAAKLAAKGYTSDPDIIEGRQGYADNFGGEKCNIPAMTKFLGKLYYLEHEGTRIKPWPCCGGNHQTLTNLLPVRQGEAAQGRRMSSRSSISAPTSRARARCCAPRSARAWKASSALPTTSRLRSSTAGSITGPSPTSAQPRAISRHS
jgi:2-methylcitrate dehydratase PrpD